MELQIYKNAELGSVRTTVIGVEPIFVGKDVAEILGYSNPRKALSDHVDEEDKMDGVTIRDSIGREQKPILINESGLYSLILRSLLFVTLLTPNYPKILQIKRRYSTIHSDEYYTRLFYPVPSVIISKSLTTKEAGTSPTKVWFPASHTQHRHAYVSARL